MQQQAEPFSTRIPPQNLEAEQGVLGACLIDQDALAKVRPILKEQDFYAARHGAIWTAILKAAAGGGVDPVTVQAFMPAPTEDEATGNLAYLAQLVSAVPSTVNAEHYAQIVAQKAKLRRIQGGARQVVDACYEADDAALMLGDLQKTIDAEARSASKASLKPVAGRIGAYAAERYANRNRPNADWIPSRFPDLRAKCPYLRGEFTLVAMPPNTGKTTLAQAEALFLAQLGYETAFFELEMQDKQLFDKWIAMDAHLEVKAIRMGLLEEFDWIVYQRHAQELDQLETLHTEAATVETMSNIRWQCLRLKAERGHLDMVIIDFLERVTEDRQRDERYDQLLAKIAGIAQGIAQECNCHVMILAQVDVRVYERSNPIPTLADLANSKTNLAAWPDNIITGIQPKRAKGDGRSGKPKIWGVECSDKRWTNTLVLSVAKGRFSEGGALIPIYTEMPTGFMGSLQRPWPWQKTKCPRTQKDETCPMEQPESCPLYAECPLFRVGMWDKAADDAHREAMKAYREQAIAVAPESVNSW